MGRKRLTVQEQIKRHEVEIARLRALEGARSHTSSPRYSEDSAVAFVECEAPQNSIIVPVRCTTKDEVFAGVKKVLVFTLAVEDSEVVPSARLSTDLKADSIDHLDLTFKLEKCFQIKIPKGELFPEIIFTDPVYVNNERLTALGMAEIKRRMSFADLSVLESDPDVHNFKNVYTVDTLVRFLCTKLEIPLT